MIRDTKSVPVRGLKIVTASEKCGGSVLNLGWWWLGGGAKNRTRNETHLNSHKETNQKDMIE